MVSRVCVLDGVVIFSDFTILVVGEYLESVFLVFVWSLFCFFFNDFRLGLYWRFGF